MPFISVPVCLGSMSSGVHHSTLHELTVTQLSNLITLAYYLVFCSSVCLTNWFFFVVVVLVLVLVTIPKCTIEFFSCKFPV